MMLETITLRNFQRHRHYTLELDPEVTVLVGPNSAGKTTIIRAAYWACFNQPTNPHDWMVRHGRKNVSVALKFSDCEVSRHKGGKNVYRMDGKRYVSFGAGKVPQDIAAALNVSPANFQRQADPAFWISESPGEVSRRLNAVVDLSVIDASLANSQAIIRRTKAETAVCESRLQKARLRKVALAWVPAMLERFSELESLNSRLESTREKSRRIASLLSDARRVALTARNAADEVAGASALVSLAQRVFDLRAKRVKLRSLLDSITRAEVALVPAPDYSTVQVYIDQYRGAVRRQEKLRHLLARIATEEAILRQSQRSIEAVEKEIEEKTGGICPVCGSSRKVDLLE